MFTQFYNFPCIKYFNLCGNNGSLVQITIPLFEKKKENKYTDIEIKTKSLTILPHPTVTI